MKNEEAMRKLLKELDEARTYTLQAYGTWKDATPLYPNRETWLIALSALLKTHFNEAGYHLKGSTRVSCGWPRGKKVIIGQCWSYTMSKDKTTEIFISPNIDDPLQVADTLAHELVHAAVGIEAGHKTPFKRCAQAIGLMGKMTSTFAGPELLKRLADMFDQLGIYPHATLRDIDSKKQTTRLIKIVCPKCLINNKLYTARITRQWLDTAGAPLCPICHDQMKEEGGN